MKLTAVLAALLLGFVAATPLSWPSSRGEMEVKPQGPTSNRILSKRRPPTEEERNHPHYFYERTVTHENPRISWARDPGSSVKARWGLRVCDAANRTNCSEVVISGPHTNRYLPQPSVARMGEFRIGRENRDGEHVNLTTDKHDLFRIYDDRTGEYKIRGESQIRYLGDLGMANTSGPPIG